jgi:phosphatidylglycerol---prolipoprotein diacylglyceryl transferase
LITHAQFDPIAFSVGPVSVHWYGLSYLAAFAAFVALATIRIRQAHFARAGWTPTDVQDLLLFGVMGALVGGRVGYVVVYMPGYYIEHPLEIFAIWKGGMAFHGGLVGVIAALAIYAQNRGRHELEVTDLVAPCVPLGLAFGRLANFINGELWGRPADPSLPWAMVFPQSGSAAPRHPSQLYQLFLEGLVLFVLLWLYAQKPSTYTNRTGTQTWGKVSGFFLVGYGVFRFIGEWFREPDSFLGLLMLSMSMGQWLCVPMILAGVFLWATAHFGPSRSAPGRNG